MFLDSKSSANAFSIISYFLGLLAVIHNVLIVSLLYLSYLVRQVICTELGICLYGLPDIELNNT